MKHPSFSLVTQVLGMFESLLSFTPALILGILELDLLSLLIQILSLLGPGLLVPFGSDFEFIRANPFASEVHVLSMSEPLFSFCFLGQFLLLFAVNENLHSVYTMEVKLEMEN